MYPERQEKILENHPVSSSVCYKNPVSIVIMRSLHEVQSCNALWAGRFCPSVCLFSRINSRTTGRNGMKFGMDVVPFNTTSEPYFECSTRCNDKMTDEGSCEVDVERVSVRRLLRLGSLQRPRIRKCGRCRVSLFGDVAGLPPWHLRFISLTIACSPSVPSSCCSRKWGLVWGKPQPWTTSFQRKPIKLLIDSELFWRWRKPVLETLRVLWHVQKTKNPVHCCLGRGRMLTAEIVEMSRRKW